MVALFSWAVTAFAFSWVIADAKVSLSFRMALDTAKHKKVFGAGALLTLVECVACSGWWTGLIGQIVGVAPFSSLPAAAFFTCGSNLLLAKWVGLLDDN